MTETNSQDHAQTPEVKDMVRFFSGNTVRHLTNDTSRPYRDGEVPKGEYIRPYFENLHQRIEYFRYMPDVPRAYNLMDKGHGVPRVVPVLSFQDLAVYYFCFRRLERSVSKGRVDRTFGGYLLSSLITERELDEAEQYQEAWDAERAEEMASYGYFGGGSIRPDIWVKEWKAFTRLAFHTAKTSKLAFAVKFDIANFYDNIPLDKLELKLRKACDSGEEPIVDLLFVFLRYWNRAHEGYPPKSVGLPQDESGDSSRLFANMYLQDYDRWMTTKAEEIGAVYLRYADDQIVFGNDIDKLYELLFSAGVYLRREGLNLNAGKVRAFHSMDDFNRFWAFQHYQLLPVEASDDDMEIAAAFIVERCIDNNDFDWRWDGLLKRLLTLGINRITPETRKSLIRLTLSDSRITLLPKWHLNRLWTAMDETERVDLLETIDRVSPKVPFNQFHLELVSFYKHARLHQRIQLAEAEANRRSLESTMAF